VDKKAYPALPNFKTGTYNMVESGFPSVFTTSDNELGNLLFALRKTIYGDRRLLFFDGRVVMACINWIRDHVHEMKAFMHWEYDLISFFQFFLDNQSEEGWYFELVKQLDDEHWKFVSPEFTRLFPEDNVAATRLELEADIEYLMVEGAVLIYRVTGDDEWIKNALPKLENGIDYLTSHKDRWDEAHGLVKRPFTIDTWDFTYGKSPDNRRIEADTPMSIMHGDNSGVYQAMLQLAWLRERFGDEAKSAEWKKRAEILRGNMMKYLWNGHFFIHQLHLNHSGADGLEKERLSLSNTYDMNRGVTTPEQNRAILNEYLKRRDMTHAFAEWFSIDPPYQDFGGIHRPGTYVNGGIASYCAGELAKAAFMNGMEEYGWDIIKRINALIKRDGQLYFLYNPQTGANLGGGPSGWGAAALMSAVEEGLAGICDLDTQYRVMGFSPRWVVTGYTGLRYITGYERAHVMIDVYFVREDGRLSYLLSSPAREIRCHIMLPTGAKASVVSANGQILEFEHSSIGDSVYADFLLFANGQFHKPSGQTANCIWEIEIDFE